MSDIWARLDGAFARYLRQPVDDDLDWDASAEHLDECIRDALLRGDPIEQSYAREATVLKGRIDARRASLRGQN
jgi:hypothetical protein